MDNRVCITTRSGDPKKPIKLYRDLHYECTPELMYKSTLVIPKGFKYEGATIPKIAWSVIGVTPYDPRVIRGACVHDYLYDNGGHVEVDGEPMFIPKSEADRIFWEIIQEDGIEPPTARLMRKAVEWFGKGAYEDE